MIAIKGHPGLELLIQLLVKCVIIIAVLVCAGHFSFAGTKRREPNINHHASPEYASLRLLPGEEKRIRHGHLWVYSNEVDNKNTPLKTFTAGQMVRIEDQRGKGLALGYVNPRSLIAVRVLTRRHLQRTLGRGFYKQRLLAALHLREQYYSQPYYRWVFAEADGLPGLILDRYGDTVVGQINTAGMQARQATLEAAIRDVLAPACLIWRNDTPMRALEGLDAQTQVAFGEQPEMLPLIEGKLHFELPLDGQKTGWFYDQTANRQCLTDYLKPGLQVLDLFSYMGAWGLTAAAHGAQVVCVDSSAKAVKGIQHNAQLNGLAAAVSAEQNDASEYLRQARQQARKFDLVIVDPPAFIKRAKDRRNGLRAYQRINQQALQVLKTGGILLSCSCSYHLTGEDLQQQIMLAARQIDREVQVLEYLQQGPDHPILLAMPETRYLKGLVLHVTKTF